MRNKERDAPLGMNGSDAGMQPTRAFWCVLDLKDAALKGGATQERSVCGGYGHPVRSHGPSEAFNSNDAYV